MFAQGFDQDRMCRAITAQNGSVFFRRQDLLAAIHAGLQVDMVRTAQLAGVLVLDIGRGADGIMATAHAALGRGGFALRDRHRGLSNSQRITGRRGVPAGMSGGVYPLRPAKATGLYRPSHNRAALHDMARCGQPRRKPIRD